MIVEDRLDCIDTLVDMLCYEVRRGRLSPEMEALLTLHLEQCPACNRRVRSFLRLMDDASRLDDSEPGQAAARIKSRSRAKPRSDPPGKILRFPLMVQREGSSQMTH